MGALGEQFKNDDRGRHSEWLRQQRWFIKSRQDHQRREHIADKVEDGVAALANEVIMATQTQIRTFEVKLDSYDQATVAALMENQELLDAVNARIQDMLARAYVMEDGRRVFKTEDGTQVFDEDGAEISVDELDPLLIGDDRPTWEAYSADNVIKNDLTAQRIEIIEFQDKADAAREQIADGEISEADLAELDADLLDAMPDAVRGHVAGLDPREPAASLKAEAQPSTALPAAQTQSAEVSTPTLAPA